MTTETQREEQDLAALPMFRSRPASVDVRAALAGTSTLAPATNHPASLPGGGDVPTSLPATAAGEVVDAAADREFWRTVRELREEVSRRLTDDLEARGVGGTDVAAREALGQRHIQQVVKDESERRLARNLPALDADYERRLLKALFDAMFRLGRLQPLVDRENVVNIEISGHDRVLLLFADGSHEWAAPVADSDDDLIAFVAFLAARDPNIEHTFTRSSPHLEMPLPGRARLAAAAWVTPRPRVTIRLQHLKEVDLPILRDLGTIDRVLEEFLKSAVLARKTFVIAGQGQGSGKTTLLRGLASALPPMESIATIETDFELYLHEEPERHGRVFAQQARPGSGELTAAGTRAGAITTSMALEKALRHNIDRIIVGEVRGQEVVAMFEAMQGGNGSMSTVHADSARDAIERLAGIAAKDKTLSETYAYRQIAQTIDLIIYISVERDDSGAPHRFISQIIEPVKGERENPYNVTDVFVPGADGRAVPANAPSFVDDLVRVGFDRKLLNARQGLWHEGASR